MKKSHIFFSINYHTTSPSSALTQELQAQLATNDEKYHQLSQEISSLTHQVDTVSTENASLTTQIEALSSTNATLTSQIDTMTSKTTMDNQDHLIEQRGQAMMSQQKPFPDPYLPFTPT